MMEIDVTKNYSMIFERFFTTQSNKKVSKKAGTEVPTLFLIIYRLLSLI